VISVGILSEKYSQEYLEDFSTFLNFLGFFLFTAIETGTVGMKAITFRFKLPACRKRHVVVFNSRIRNSGL
jgi:hypothetical protein